MTQPRLRPQMAAPLLATLLLVLMPLFFGALPARALSDAERDAALARLEAAVAQQSVQITALKAQVSHLETAQGVASASVSASPNLSANTLKQFLYQNNALGTAIYVSGNDLYMTGFNVHIVSGSGSTSDGTYDLYGSPTGKGSLTGLGNLIIGYNGLNPNTGTNGMTGSHNLILGDGNTYASFGGVVASSQNTISSPYATVTGGSGNTASGLYSSIAGGGGNTASNGFSSVFGGIYNTATGFESSVFGGDGNIASGFLSSAGGSSNTASGEYASVFGGINNIANARFASVTGGEENQAISDYSSVSGGYRNVASGMAASVSGGYSNTASGDYSSVSGGYHNMASGSYDYFGNWNGVGPTWWGAGISGH